jgi:hypothetical protein
VGLGRLDPLHEFQKQISEAFLKLREAVEERIVETFAAAKITKHG